MTLILVTLILAALTGAGMLALSRRDDAETRLISIPVPADAEPRATRTRRSA